MGSIFVFLCCLLCLWHFGSAQNVVDCNTLGVTAHMVACSPALPTPVNGVLLLQPNKEYTCKLELTFNFTSLYKNVTYANLAVGYGSLGNYQLAPVGNFWTAGMYWIAGDSEGEINSPSTIVIGNFTVPPNAIGMYFSGWSMSIWHLKEPYLIYCFMGAHSYNWTDAMFAPVALVQNTNNEVADVTPPYVFSIRAEHTIYRPGQVVRTFAYISDLSPLNMGDGWTGYTHNNSHSVGCPGAEWSSMAQHEIEKYNLPLISTVNEYPVPQTQGWFYTTCQIDNNAAPGRYNLSLLNIFDMYYNGVDTAPFWAQTVGFTIIQ